MAHRAVDELVNAVLDANQIAVLRQRLGAVTDAQWEAALDGFVTAAFAEYTGAMLNSVAPITRADEVQQQRLLELIRRGAFQSGMPTETQIAALFHLTPTRARTLLRNVLSRFEPELHDYLQRVLTEALKTAIRDEKDVVTIQIANPLVADGLQAILDNGNTTAATPFPLKRMVRDPDVRGRWTIPFDPYQYMCKILNLPLAPQKK